MKIDGRFHCGEIAYEAEADPAALRICHCMDCQTLSGSAFRANVSVSAEHFKLLAGESKALRRDGGRRQRAAACVLRKLWRADLLMRSGSSGELFASNRNHQTARAAFTPGKQIWRRSALRWVDALASVPATEKE